MYTNMIQNRRNRKKNNLKSRQLKKYVLIYISTYFYADVAELVDAPDSKSKWIFLYINPKSIDSYMVWVWVSFKNLLNI